MRENGTKSVGSQQDQLAEILTKREQRRAQSAKEADHYGKAMKMMDSERLKSVLRNVLF